MPLLLSQHDLLVVSDLHLSEGRDPVSKQVSRLEDFLFDEEFTRFLEYHMAQGERRWHFIINGDFCDFLQVVSTDPDQAYCDYMGFSSPQQAYDALAKGDRPEYGFGSGPRETVYKLWRIMDGHWMFFEALADFIVAGNVLSIGRGNHDPEFIYPEVQRAFREKLKIIFQDKLQQTQAADVAAAVNALARAMREDDPDSRLRFIDWFYYEPRLLWVEHGSQYDKLNSFDYWLAPFLPKMKSVAPKNWHDIDLPWGSFFVRYLFNQVEYDEPFADNIKPLTKFLGWFLRTHPLLAIRFLSSDAPYMLKRMARAWRNPPSGAYDGCRHLHQLRLAEDADACGIDRGKLQKIDAQKDPTVLRHPRGVTWTIVKWLTRAWPVSLTILFLLLIYLGVTGAGVAARLLAPFAPLRIVSTVHNWWWIAIPGVVRTVWLGIAIVAVVVYAMLQLSRLWDCICVRDNHADLSYLAKQAIRLRRTLRVKYITMGHTHDTDMVSRAPGGRIWEYFNTGTWTKVFSPQERLIREESELVFLQGVRDGTDLTMKLMKWNDGAGEPRLVKLWEPERRGWCRRKGRPSR